MRLGRFRSDDGPAWCGIRNDQSSVVHLPEAGDGVGVFLPYRMRDLLADPRWDRKVELVVEYARETGTGLYEIEDLEQLAPVGAPDKIVCVGLNYRDHAEEGDNPIPDEPVLFAKFPTAITGPNAPIEWDPDYTKQVDYEAELVTAIGNKAREVDREDAFDHVAGYTVGNDVSARDLQHGDGQWVRGKSLDTFAPTGPDLVTPDDVSDPHDLAIWTEVNGTRLQESSTSNLIFGIDELVAFCSRAFTLNPGDLIFTGTPPGVGVYRDPPELLEAGDTVTVGVEAVGELTNPCAHR